MKKNEGDLSAKVPARFFLHQFIVELKPTDTTSLQPKKVPEWQPDMVIKGNLSSKHVTLYHQKSFVNDVLISRCSDETRLRVCKIFCQEL